MTSPLELFQNFLRFGIARLPLGICGGINVQPTDDLNEIQIQIQTYCRLAQCLGVCGGFVQLADKLDEGNAGEAALAALVILLLLVFLQPIQC